jgi:transposase InsO family protein
MSRIVCLHGVLKNIVSDRGTQFTSKFWERLHETLDTQLHFSSSYHPQTDGLTERVNQTLEDMLRDCALQYGEVGIRVCRMPSSPTTTAIKKA